MIPVMHDTPASNMNMYPVPSGYFSTSLGGIIIEATKTQAISAVLRLLLLASLLRNYSDSELSD